MFWVIEYINGKTISEKDINFKSVDKQDIKYLYYVVNNNEKIGINCQTGFFFIRNSQYDFKIGNGPYFPLQFKKDYMKFQFDGSRIIETAFNIGCFKFELEFKFKYFLSINKHNISINAVKEDKNGNEIANKILQINSGGDCK